MEDPINFDSPSPNYGVSSPSDFPITKQVLDNLCDLDELIRPVVP